METTYLTSKAISSVSNRKKNLHLSHVLFKLSGFEDGATGKSQNINWSKFLTLYFLKTIFWLNDRLRHCFFLGV